MKIAIDLGHGIGQDRGAEGFVTEESIINSVGAYVIAKLKALGHTVIETRPLKANTVANSLIQRVDLANNSNVDLYVSIHANAGGGRGTEVFTYRGQEVEQAREVLNNIVELGFINRGIKSSNLFVINQTKAKAMLIEICFVDTKTDMELYNSIGAEKVAYAIVSGLVGETINTPVSAPIAKAHVVKDNWVYRLQGVTGTSQDSIPGPITLSKCPLVKKDSTGEIVKLLQERLKTLGYNCGYIDGYFGNNTKAAVMRYQANNGLVADGIVGPNTWRKLLGLS